MLRAGPFSDERIVGLANRRFIAFYFDLSNRGFAGDAQAREFVVAKREELGRSSVPTPPVLFMTAGGEVLAEVSNYASPEEALRTMQDVLAKHPEYDKLSAAEKEARGIALARIQVDLLDYAAARKTLAGEESAEAHYLSGHLDRLDGDWKAMDAHFAKVSERDLADDVWMERAHRAWSEGEFKKLKAELASFPRESNRYAEARYHLGLASYHLGEIEDALSTWKEMIGACSEDPWVYRADWAHDNATRDTKPKGGKVTFSSGGSKTPLGRIGYMGRRNPDLNRTRRESQE